MRVLVPFLRIARALLSLKPAVELTPECHQAHLAA